MATHQAAVLVASGQPLEIQSRATPKPGPGELLIAVKAVALNPADHIIRDTGLFITSYPTVIGFDIAGLVLEAGENVPTKVFQAGSSRVVAYAASFWRGYDADYGAFQEKCLVPWQHAVPVPERLSWVEATTLPVAVQVPLCAWDAMGIPRTQLPLKANSVGKESCSTVQSKNEALLIWGASSSIGTMGVQSGRLLKLDPNNHFGAVYATCGAAIVQYVSSLGADRVFDHKSPHVVDEIISAARDDGLVIRHCYLATGELKLCQSVLKVFEQADGGKGSSKIATAVPVPANAEVVDGVEVMFLMPSNEEDIRLEQFQYWFGTWLVEVLAAGAVKPSPKPQVVGNGLNAINKGLDILKQGVSCTKLVVVLDP